MNLVKAAFAATITGLMLSAQPILASEDLAQNSGCLSCHGISNKILGPGYTDIAAKYKGNADAAAELADKIKNGTSGDWGPIPMPPNAHVSDENINKLVAWILAM